MRRMLLPVALLAVLAGCNNHSSGTGAAPSEAASAALAEPADTGTPLTSVQEIMQGRIIPTSDLVWNATGVTFEGGKEIHLAPKNDAEWAALAKAAKDIRVGAAALQKPGLPVAPAGATILNQNVAGALGVTEVQALVDKDRPGFASHAKVLEEVGRNLEAAVAKRNVDQLMDLGGKMDEACESCHKVYWYPNT